MTGEPQSQLNMANLNRSYFVGFNLSGWEYGYYFTYYSEFQRDSFILPYTEAVILTLVFLIGITSNFLVLLILCTSKEKAVPSNYFIGGLAAAGIMCVASVPMMAVTRVTGTWLFGRVACGATAAMQYCATIINVWTMAFISLDRHQGAYKRTPFSLKTIITMLVPLWAVAILGSVPLGMFFLTTDVDINNEAVTVCTLIWPNNSDIRWSMAFIPPSVLVMFILPLGIILVSYTRVVNKMKDSINKFKASKQNTSLWSHVRTLFGEHKEMRVVRLLILLVVCFCVLWMPISISFIMIFYDGITESLNTTSQFFISAVCVAMTNSCISPIIYGFVNERLRKGFLKMIHRRNNKIDNSSIFNVDVQSSRRKTNPAIM